MTSSLFRRFSVGALTLSIMLAMSCSMFEGSDDDAGVAPPPTLTDPGLVNPPTSTPTSGGGTPSTPGPDSLQVSVTYSYPLIWPAAGPVASFMSPEHNTGIDISLAGSSKRVRAAAAGKVIYSGNADSEVGLAVEIDHGNGLTTAYGHLALSLVEAGEEVEIGQTIAQGGSSGHAVGDELHFEVLSQGQTLNPLDVLPETPVDTQSLRHDCLWQPLRLSAGSEATLDFRLALLGNESVLSAALLPQPESAPASAEAVSPTQVLFSTPLDYSLPEQANLYDLEVDIDGPNGSRSVTCQIQVEKTAVSPTVYARATATPDAGQLASGGPRSDLENGGDAGDDEMNDAGTPEPAATPTPALGVPGPSTFEQPEPSAGGGPDTPSYERP